MAADANIFQQYLKAPKSIMEYQQEADQSQARKNALQLAAMDLSEKTQATQRAQQVRSALMGLGAGATDDQRISALKSTATPEGFSQADALEKALLERQKTGAQVTLSTAQAGHATAQTDAENFKTRIAKSDQAIKDISGFQTPQEALASLEQHAASGDIPPEQAQVIRQSLTTMSPADFPKWQLGMVQNIMTAKERMQYLAPDANAKLQATTSTANNAATNATHVQTTGMTNATSRANNQATIAAENMRAGVNADGAPSADMETTAKAIANGQLMPPSGMALLNPKNQRILARVMEINPSYDATTVTAKKAAATAFTTGKEGAMMRSLQVANNHLDQLGTLADAMDNGNMQIINKIGNTIATQTGNPAPTNFDAAKEIVSKEVVKGIVAGGGGVSERAEAAHILDSAKSPKQLKGAIQQLRNLMSAQHEALLQQRRAAGLPDSTLPNYTDGSGSPAAPAVPADIDALLKKHGGK